MISRRDWRYRLYPSKSQMLLLNHHLYECKTLWNSLLEHTKTCYGETGKFPTRDQLYLLTKETTIFSQIAQNVASRLARSIKGMIARKNAGLNFGFPRFKSTDRTRSFTYPQFGYRLERKLELSGIGRISIRKHRGIRGKIKTLTIKKTASGKWFAIFTSEIENTVPKKKQGPKVGIDLGVEHFACLSNGEIIENPRHLKKTEQKLKELQWHLSRKEKGGKNRKKAKFKVATTYEKLTNRRLDFLHKLSRKITNNYFLIALEDLKVGDISRGFLAKHILDCSWARFTSMLTYKAAEAGCEVVLVNPTHTTQECSNCGQMHKKPLAERWHICSCGASMHRDLNAAINILNRATAGTAGSQACLRRDRYPSGQVSSMKQETHGSSQPWGVHG